MPRAFTAIDIPQNIAERLSQVQEELEVGKPTRPEKMHITLEFFQDLDSEEIDKLQNHLEKLETKTFQIEIKGLGVFPSEKYIRVIWAGVNSEKIHELHRESSKHNLESDNNHKFRPHVTIARVNDVRRGDKKKIHETLEKHSEEVFGSFKAEELKLYRSDLGADSSKQAEIYSRKL